MIFSTIYKKELRASSRSYRLPLAVALLNTVMAVMVLTSMTLTIETARETSTIDYDAFYKIFVVMTMAEFTFMMLAAPALSGGSISREAERRTLDMMLATRLSAADIVLGKLMWFLSSAMLVTVSSLPIMAILFVYGYVRIHNIVLMLLTVLSMELYVGGIGLWISAAVMRTAIAVAAAYTVLLMLVCGIPLLCAVASGLTGTEGTLEWLLCLNPAVPFASFLARAAGRGGMMASFFRMIGISGDTDAGAVAGAAAVIQPVLGVFFSCMAARCISSDRRN